MQHCAPTLVNEPNATGQAHLLDVIDRVTPLYESIFDLAFPLPKLYWMATQAFQGGIEHWGLITGGSASSDWSPRKGGSSKASITSFAAHEVAHQWFANIVTMEWWTDLWLNEAFATYASDVVTGPILDPDFNTWLPFLDKNVELAMQVDATASHPIVNEIISEDQFGAAFDSITYLKGASVLRQIASVLGEKRFLKGVSNYLKKFAYQNAEGKDLWEEVGKLTKGYDVTAFADAWTKLAGFPVVHVEKVQPGLFLLTQKRYFSDQRSGKGNNQTWPIPLFADLTIKQEDSIMYDKATFVQLPTDDQLVLNRERQGFYRVLYDKAGYDFLSHALHTRTHLSGIDRAAFLYDMNAFAKSGLVSSVEVLGLVKGIDPVEDSPSVWTAAVTFLSEVQLLIDTETRTSRDLRAFTRDVLSPLLERLDTGESALVEKLRQVTLPLAGRVGVPEVVEYSIKKFRRLERADHEEDLPDALVQVVIDTAVQYGGEEAWDRALRLAQRNDGSDISIAALKALASSLDEKHIAELLRILRHGAVTVSSRTMSSLLRSLLSNPIAKDETLDWISPNLNDVFSRFPNLGLRNVFTSIFSVLHTRDDLEKLTRAFDKYPVYKLDLQPALEIIENSIAWFERDAGDIARFLAH